MRPRETLAAGVAVGLALGVGGIAAQAQTMVGQAHDFSTRGFARGEICLPCHTPHNSMTDANGDRIAKLWNHELTTATYTLYDGSTGDVTIDFDRVSRLCMSCHDGTVALDSFGGQTGVEFIGGDELLGTDLRNDHPVGSQAEYPEAGSPYFNAANNGRVGPNGELRLASMDIAGVSTKVVGCRTCHTPHFKGFDHQLNMTNASSALCLSCHIK